MVSLFFFIFLVLAVFFGVKSIKKYKSTKKTKRKEYVFCFYIVGAVICASISVVSFGIGLVLFNKIGTGFTIENRIAMYEEENTSIEESIESVVKDYMDYESSTFEKLKDKDGISLISLYPDLKSNTLAQKQIKVYVDNNNKIKELKEEMIYLSKLKWMLYFGR